MTKETLDRAKNLEYLIEELEAIKDKFSKKDSILRGLSLSGMFCREFREEFTDLCTSTLVTLKEEFDNL